MSFTYTEYIGCDSCTRGEMAWVFPTIGVPDSFQRSCDTCKRAILAKDIRGLSRLLAIKIVADQGLTAADLPAARSETYALWQSILPQLGEPVAAAQWRERRAAR